MPSPASSSGQVTTSGPAPASSSDDQEHDPEEKQGEADPHDTTRGCRGNSLGTPTAAASSVTDRGSRRTPVATADSPRATERKRG